MNLIVRWLDPLARIRLAGGTETVGRSPKLGSSGCGRGCGSGRRGSWSLSAARRWPWADLGHQLLQGPSDFQRLKPRSALRPGGRRTAPAGAIRFRPLSSSMSARRAGAKHADQGSGSGIRRRGVYRIGAERIPQGCRSRAGVLGHARASPGRPVSMADCMGSAMACGSTSGTSLRFTVCGVDRHGCLARFSCSWCEE